MSERMKPNPEGVTYRREYDGTSGSAYTMSKNPPAELLDEAVTKAILPDIEPGEVGLSVREARYVGARVVGLTKRQSVAYAEGNMSMTERSAAHKVADLERNVAGEVVRIRQHIATVTAELLREGLSLKDMANLAVSTFAEIASNASGAEKTSDRNVAATQLAKISGLYDVRGEEKGVEDSEDALTAEITRKLNKLLAGAGRSPIVDTVKDVEEG